VTPDESLFAELNPLLEALCEERLEPADATRLEQLVLASPEARWYYITYLDLHGSLYWNAAGAGSADALSTEIPVTGGVSLPIPISAAAPRVWLRRDGWRTVLASITCAALAAVLIGVWGFRPEEPLADRPHSPVTPSQAERSPAPSPTPRHHGPPIQLVQETPSPTPPAPVVPSPPEPPRRELDSEQVVAEINRLLRERWEVAEVRPSDRADDAEFVRRVTLDLIGRIPSLEEVQDFLADRNPRKREYLVEQLLDGTEFPRNWTTVWTNILIGRRSDERVNRVAFQKFLRTSFAANRPWNQIVYDLVAAEGNNLENGATNFLIAHLNNDALPATAVTARVFLGEQLQCNQCHNNPFNKSQQSDFWQMHSFFSQTVCVPRVARDPETGQARYSYTELVTDTAGGPIFYETQNGVMRVAYPQFGEESVDPSPETNRRAMLGRLMTAGDRPQLAAAHVNRLWFHFFGQGFTPSPDDMGAHTPASHPELLDLLARQFIQSGYDTRQLIRWICASEAYQLTSRFGAHNTADDPVEGQTPLFSRMYVKPMSPEQVYDSFVIATRAHESGAVDWEQAETQRQRWLTQFVVDYKTDENEEAISLDGNLVQALTLMNGKLAEKALDTSRGTYLSEIIRRRAPETDKIRELCLATLSRYPTASELAGMRRLIRQDPSTTSQADGYQDLMWALLNSHEFSVVH